MPLSITLRGSILWDDFTESNSVSTLDGTGQLLERCLAYTGSLLNGSLFSEELLNVSAVRSVEMFLFTIAQVDILWWVVHIIGDLYESCVTISETKL